MKLTLRPLSIGMLGLALLAFARTSSADYSLMTATATFGSSTSQLMTSTTVNSTFQLFDSNLGTLEAVSIVLQQTATVSSSVTNLSMSSPYLYSVVTRDKIIVTAPDGTRAGSNVYTSTVSGSIGAGNMLTNLGTSTGTTSSNDVVATDLTKYIGAGTGTMSITGTTVTEGENVNGPSGFLSFGGAANFYGTVTVYYSYLPATPVPEPASLGMAVIGLGTISVAGLVRRRNKNQVA